MNVTISIVIPTYDRPRKLARAIRSALEQTPSEIIVVDNGENPETLSTVQSLQSVAENVPIHYHQSEPFKIRTALSKGIEAAESDWIILLDDDDFLIQNRIANDIEKLSSIADDCGILLNDFVRVDYEHRQLWEHRMAHKNLDLYDALVFDNFPPAAAASFRSSIVKNHHSYGLDGGNMDFDLFASLLPHCKLEKSSRIGYIMDDTRSKDRITTSSSKIPQMLALHRERFREQRKLVKQSEQGIDTRIDQHVAFFSGKYEGLAGLRGNHSALVRSYFKEWFKGYVSPCRSILSRYLGAILPEMRGSKSFTMTSYQKSHVDVYDFIISNQLMSDR